MGIQNLRLLVISAKKMAMGDQRRVELDSGAAQVPTGMRAFLIILIIYFSFFYCVFLSLLLVNKFYAFLNFYRGELTSPRTGNGNGTGSGELNLLIIICAGSFPVAPLCPLGWPEHCGYHSLTSFQRAWNFFGLQNAESAMWKTRNAKALRMLKMLENACIKLFIVSAARNANAAKYCIKSSLSLCHDTLSLPLLDAGFLLQVYCPSGRHFVWPARILLICQRKSQKKVAFVFRCLLPAFIFLPAADLAFSLSMPVSVSLLLVLGKMNS